VAIEKKVIEKKDKHAVVEAPVLTGTVKVWFCQPCRKMFFSAMQREQHIARSQLH
jgi:hypothetical protein